MTSTNFPNCGRLGRMSKYISSGVLPQKGATDFEGTYQVTSPEPADLRN